MSVHAGGSARSIVLTVGQIASAPTASFFCYLTYGFT